METVGHLERDILLPFASIRLNFNHLDIQNRRGDINWLPFMRVMVTPAVYPRWFEFPTTLTFRNHIVSTAFETIAKKKTERQRRLVVHVRSAIYHELSKTQPKLERKCVSVGVDVLAVVWRKKRDLINYGSCECLCCCMDDFSRADVIDHKA